jgi:adenosylhomocysteine nucleosidase
MTRVAIIAAMTGELKPLVRGWEHERRNGVNLWRRSFDEGEWVAACAGAGQDAATRAFAEIDRNGAVDIAISTGWAGALSDGLLARGIYRVTGVIDARTGERFTAEAPADSSPRSTNRDLGHPGFLLVTSPKVADESEKRRLAATYKADLVDMEAAGVARLAQIRGIPFYCIKGVSDGFTDNLPDFNRFISTTGQFQLPKFIAFVLLRPWYWRGLARMGENSRKAAQGIAETLLDILDNRGEIRERNGHPNFKH